MIIERCQGRSGTILVEDLAGLRRLYLNGQLQGCVHLEPAAERFFPHPRPGPGPVQGCTFSCAWLMAAALRTPKRALMLGLGCGEGVVGLLFNFPELRLDVVEIDPVMIDVATRFFPMLACFTAADRLTVHRADVVTFLDRPLDPYDLIIFDITTGENSPSPLLTEPSILSRLARARAAVWLNVLMRPEQPRFHRLIATLGAAGLPIRHAFSALPVSANTLVSIAPLDEDRLAHFTPYRQLDHPSADMARRKYQRLLSSRLELGTTPVA